MKKNIIIKNVQQKRKQQELNIYRLSWQTSQSLPANTQEEMEPYSSHPVQVL